MRRSRLPEDMQALDFNYLINLEPELAKDTNKDYNALKRESDAWLRENNQTGERGADYGTDIQMGRRLSNTEY